MMTDYWEGVDMDNKKKIVASIRMSFDIIAKKNMPIYGSWKKTSKIAKWWHFYVEMIAIQFLKVFCLKVRLK